MKYIFLTFITLACVITCCNVQAIRDEYAAGPSPIEAAAVKVLDNMGGD